MSHIIVIRIPGLRLSRSEALALLPSAVSRAHPPFVCVGADAPQTYIYALHASSTQSLAPLRRRLRAACAGAEAQLFTLMQDVSGASHGEHAFWHYVVETDVRTDAEADFNAWYEQEHLPGLAGVPGTVRAIRMRNTDPGATPRYHACYLLQTRETYGSPAWLAVRATRWSSAVRPNFRNTRRTMFSIAA
ncbi:hypothetical protein ERD78_14670 [Allopusillimonas soli]|uniref:ABM domain-containing protein n=1 Tax=Allopusillimonas soli TaxID=659016 RepID=A0A853FDW7_9BURK|nr:DUF4286 family protein [Allopusillimonas soli]NYT38127.1 hypothetical protein [Allopusillimonas soli]TEA74004.1 hypothetical protein ERD78_14670 [Allopusillimonas soli]